MCAPSRTGRTLCPSHRMGKASWAQDPDVWRGAIERETVSLRTAEDPDPALNLDLRRHEPALMQDCPWGDKPWSPEGSDTLRPSRA